MAHGERWICKIADVRTGKMQRNTEEIICVCHEYGLDGFLV